MSPTLQELIKDGNHQPLLKVLRRHPNPRMRIEAANAISRLQDPDCVEALIRSLLDDPDPEVRLAANAAINECLGKIDAALAIKAYGPVDGVMPYEVNEFPVDLTSHEEYGASDDESQDDSEPEPESDEITAFDVSSEFLDFSIEEKPVRWDTDEIEPLILILKNDNHPDRQMKALRIIGANLSPIGIDALATVALWSENRLVKNAAYQVLERQYGEDTTRFLDEFQTSQTTIAVEENDEVVLEIDQSHSNSNQPALSQYSTGATIEPEGVNARGVLFMLVILIAIAAFMVYWFMLR
jgi:hypothetical protein